MKATAEIQAIPIGAGVSVRREVQRAHELLEQSGLIIETPPRERTSKATSPRSSTWWNASTPSGS